MHEPFEQDINVYNEENNTPLHWACLNGHIEVIIVLDAKKLLCQDIYPMSIRAGG